MYSAFGLVQLLPYATANIVYTAPKLSASKTHNLLYSYNLEHYSFLNKVSPTTESPCCQTITITLP